MAGIAQDAVEIDDAVELTALAYPGIDPLAHQLLPGGVEAGMQGRVLERGDGGADDSDPLLPGALDELSVAGYQGLRGDALRLGREGTGKADVVAADAHDDVADAGLSQHVTVEARHASLAEGGPELAAHLRRTATQQPIADEPLIEDAQGAA